MADNKITLEQVLEVVKELPRDRKNPKVRIEGRLSCVYTVPDDPDQHCIAGEICARLRVPLPNPGETANKQQFRHTMMSDRFSPTAMEWIAQVQEFADGWATWGEAIELAYIPK